MYDNEVVVDNNPDYIVTDPAACNNVQVCIGHPISGGYPSINIDREFCEEGGGSMSTGYANMVGIEKAALWKVIRINEDGSIRLMYVSNGAYDEESPNHPVYWISSSLTSNYGASSEYLSTIDSILNAWYETNLLDYNNYIFDSGFCNDISISILDENYYGIYDRLTNLKPKFVCSSSDNLYTLSNNKKGNEKLTYPIGLITADEAWYSGLFFDDSISDSHLSKAAGFWTMTPYGKQEPTYVAASGSLAQVESTAEIGLFPVINLKPSVQVVESSGYDIGTIDNPYVIKMTN